MDRYYRPADTMVPTNRRRPIQALARNVADRECVGLRSRAALENEWFGGPDVITTDQGRQFE